MHSFVGKRSAVAAIAVAGLGLMGTAAAVDGVVLIDQARVNAAGGFPYKITAPGSYRLASNLVAPLGKSGIDVSTGGSVSLDLNGYSISSSASCSPTGQSCTPPVSGAGTVTGVWVHDAGTGSGAFSLKNGSINGFPGYGIEVQVGGAVEIRDTKVFNNSFSGMIISTSGGQGGVSVNVIRDNLVWRNGGTGIVGGDLVIDNIVTGNGSVGLALQPTAGYRGNHLLGNGQGPVSGGVSIGSNVCAYQQLC
jgi:hypothetical protein